MTTNHNFSNEHVEIEQALKQWMIALDSGDLDGLVACCDPEIIIANDGKATGFGLEAIRDKYGPRIEQFSTQSITNLQHLMIHNDIAIAVTQWSSTITDKKSHQTRNAGGRLLLNYRRNQAGEWKVLLDVDNNGAY